MKRSGILTVASIIVLTMISVADVSIAYDSSAGARSIGLGGITAALKGADGIFGNPSGIGYMADPEFTSMYSDLTGDIRYTMLGGVFDSAIGRWSLGYSGSRTEDMYVTEINSDTGVVGATTPFSYATDDIFLGYAKRLSRELVIGARVKYFLKGTELQGTSGRGVNADVGLMYSMADNIDVGVVVYNVMPGHAGAMRWEGGTEDDIPLSVSAGGRYGIGKLDIYGETLLRRGLPTEYKAGLEYMLVDNLCLRAGIDRKSFAANEAYSNYTAGVGYCLSGIRFDYAYYIDTMVSYNSQHFVSMGLSIK